MPPYFDGLISAFHAGRSGRAVHLGLWDAATPAAVSQPDAFLQAQARLDRQMLAMAALADGQCVADIGCGFGGTLAAVNAHHERMRLLGVNIDPRQLAICRSIAARAGNVLHWIHADACALPLADASVDCLLCIEAMFHFADRRRFFAEAARVLAPGGVMVCSDIVLRPSGDDRADAAAYAEVLAGFGPWPDFWGRDADHRALAHAAGMRMTAHVDAASATVPSHFFTAPNGASARDPIGRAAAALATLHRAGRLAYLLMSFARA